MHQVLSTWVVSNYKLHQLLQLQIFLSSSGNTVCKHSEWQRIWEYSLRIFLDSPHIPAQDFQESSLFPALHVVDSLFGVLGLKFKTASAKLATLGGCCSFLSWTHDLGVLVEGPLCRTKSRLKSRDAAVDFLLQFPAPKSRDWPLSVYKTNGPFLVVNVFGKTRGNLFLFVGDSEVSDILLGEFLRRLAVSFLPDRLLPRRSAVISTLSPYPVDLTSAKPLLRFESNMAVQVKSEMKEIKKERNWNNNPRKAIPPLSLIRGVLFERAFYKRGNKMLIRVNPLD